MTKENLLEKIVDEVFAIKIPKISESRKEEILGFTKDTVNGDDIKAHLVIDVGSGESAAVLIYVLTDRRLIQIRVEQNTGINTKSNLLRDIQSVERKLMEDDRISFQANFQTNAYGLRYAKENEAATKFFQTLEQVWIKGV